MEIKLTSETRRQVQRLIELHAQMKAYEAEMALLKKSIMPFLVQAKEIKDAAGNAVVLQESNRPVMNAEFTSFELSDVQEFLTPSIKKLVTETRISNKKLTGAVELGKLPPEVLAFKKVSQVQSMVVKHTAT